MANTLDSGAENHAKTLIRGGNFDENAAWSWDPEDQNHLLGDPPNWDRYGQWHLGRDPQAAAETKAKYKYPYGKDGKVYRAAVRAIRTRSSQQGEDSISTAARGLLDLMDQQSSGNQASARAWYRFSNLAADATEADLYVYDVIGDWGVESVTASRFVKDLMALPASVRQINLHINSPGGSVFDAVAIANSLRSHRADVVVKIEGLAASAATIVAMAGDAIQIAENAVFMIHDPWAVTIGGAKDMRAQADALERVRDSIIATYKWHSQLPVDVIAALMEETTWMSAQEAVDRGFATDIGPAAQAAAHVDAAILDKLGPVPERFAELVAAEAVESGVKVRARNVAKKRERKTPSAATVAQTTKGKDAMAEEKELEQAKAEAFEDGKLAGLQEGTEAGIKAERERILAIEKITIPGHEPLAVEAKASGLTAAEFAVKQAEAEKGAREKHLAALRKDGSAPAPPARPSAAGEPTAAADDPNLPLEERAKAAWNRDAELRDEFASFEDYLAWRRVEGSSKVRVLRRG